MPSTWVVAYICDKHPCDNRTAVIKVMNGTTKAAGEEPEPYDHEGAMRFIVATVLVYSLIGVFGMLLLRIRRSATRTQRTVNMQEEALQKYMKHHDILVLEGRRDRMKKEAESVSRLLKFGLHRPMSRDSMISDTTTCSEESSFLDTSALSSSEGTLSPSPRSPHHLPTRFSFRGLPVTTLPPLPEGRDEAKAEISVFNDKESLHTEERNPMLNTAVDINLEKAPNEGKNESSEIRNDTIIRCDNNNEPPLSTSSYAITIEDV